MELYVIGAGIFIVTVIIVELISFAVRNTRAAKRGKIRKRLRKYIYVEGGQGGTEITKKRILSDVPFLNQILLHTPGISQLDRLVIQANAKQPLGFYFLLALLLTAAGFLLGQFLNRSVILNVVLPLLFGSLPLIYLANLKSKRIAKFKKQLPDGLDLIARALKAGHAFTGGLKLAADEIEEPLGTEFSETLDEINFGINVSDALKNLAARIDCEELRFFVVGVILQRETGGNLAELMEVLAGLIRERFKFDGKVRTLAAEGKLSAIILIALPFFIAGWILFSNPGYLNPLFTHTVGRLMLVFAAVMMITGIIVMKKMVNIRV